MHNLKAGANLMGVAWEGVLTADGKIALSDMMPDTAKLTSYGMEEGDYVMTWDIGLGWDATYFYINDPSWNYDDVDYTDTWMTAGMIPCSPMLEAGQAFWLFLKEDINDFAFKGQVAENGAITTLAEGMNLIANPLPRIINFADSSVVTVTGATSYDAVEGDSIMTWDIGSGWGAVYYYINQPSWNYDDVDYTDTWMTAGMMPGAAVIPVGSGFWYFATNAGTEIMFKGL